MNIHVFSIVMGLFLIFSCNHEKKEITVEEKYPDGKILSRKTYNIENNGDSVLIGEVSYYDNGIVQKDGAYKNGKLHGEWDYWYNSGKLWSNATFNEGVKNGKSSVYYENGRVRYSGICVNGKEDGKWSFWDENGKLVKDVFYNNGIKTKEISY